jgi:hypothetical protein
MGYSNSWGGAAGYHEAAPLALNIDQASCLTRPVGFQPAELCSEMLLEFEQEKE